MSAPSFAKFPGQVQTQGDYPWDPRSKVGAANSRYPTKEAIPLEDRYEGMLTVDENGALWMLRGGKTNADYLDILSLFVTLTSANAANGYAALDANGKIANAVIPSLAIGDTFVRSSEAQMLAITTAEIGDICKRTDTGETWVLQSADYTQLASWVDISSNFSGIESVNGKSGSNITLNQDEIPDGNTYKRVTQTEKDSYAGKQESLGFDDVPTFQSTKWINSGKLFDYLKTIQSSVEKKSWLGSAADGNNRFNLDAEDADIDSVIVFTEGGVAQHLADHFTVDANKRYIEFNTAPDPAKIYYLTYLSNIPVVSLTSVAVENVEGLLEQGKVKETLLPEGIGGEIETAHKTALNFDKSYISEHDVAGAIAYTFDNTDAALGKTWTIILKADGLNKPTFSGDFSIQYDGYKNDVSTLNHLYFKYIGNGKVIVNITYA